MWDIVGQEPEALCDDQSGQSEGCWRELGRGKERLGLHWYLQAVQMSLTVK